MCRFKSGIILKNKVVVAPGSDDSHSVLLEQLGIKDDYIGATKTFVRAELIPNDKAWWISPEEHPDKWKFVVDQDIIPDWFDKEAHEKEFRESVCAWWNEHVFVDKTIEELSSGYYRLKRCYVKKLLKDVQVICGSSTVQKMYDSSTVQEMYDSSTVQKMWGSSTVQEMYDSSTVQKMWGSSTVQKMYDSSTARVFKEYPNIKIMVPESGKFEMIVFNNEVEHTKL